MRFCLNEARLRLLEFFADFGQQLCAGFLVLAGRAPRGAEPFERPLPQILAPGDHGRGDFRMVGVFADKLLQMLPRLGGQTLVFSGVVGVGRRRLKAPRHLQIPYGRGLPSADRAALSRIRRYSTAMSP